MWLLNISEFCNCSSGRMPKMCAIQFSQLESASSIDGHASSSQECKVNYKIQDFIHFIVSHVSAFTKIILKN